MALNFQQQSPTPLSRVSLILAFVLSVGSLVLYQVEGISGPLHSLQSVVQASIAPLQSLVAPAGAVIEDATNSTDDASLSEETQQSLRDQIAELTQRSVQGEEYRLENERLLGLLNLKDSYDIEGVAGRVIGRTTDAWNQTVTLDVGENDGVQTGLTVMGSSGVIGQVVSVAPSTCQVRLLTDPQSGCAALIQSTRAEGIVRGSLDGLLYLENIGADVNIQVGDVVLTSGLGGSYTRGLIIGTVVRVEGSAGNNTRKIVVMPNDTVTLLEEGLVVFSAADDAADRIVTTSTDTSSATSSADNTSALSSDASSTSSGDASSEQSSGTSSSESSSSSSSSGTSSGTYTSSGDEG
jgi:rod shape-determining protein MreC